MFKDVVDITAKKWLNYLMVSKKESIDYSIEHTYIIEPFESSTSIKRRFDNMDIVVTPIDTVSAIFSYSDGNSTGALNFANFTEPGGGFLRGAIAQEECLCHESTLYPVLLSQKDEFYIKNTYLNPVTFTNRSLYSESIEFIRKEQSVTCDILTCAAPCLCGVNINPDDPYIVCALYSRIDSILNTFYDMNASTLILGAFGCGAFANDPLIVATIFRELLTNKYNKCFEKVVFAIPTDNTMNFQIFNTFFNSTIDKQVMDSLLLDLEYSLSEDDSDVRNI